MKIMVTGDIHRDFPVFNQMLNQKRPDIVLCCGDFGYWPREPLEEIYGRMHKKYPRERPAPKVPDGCNVFWCDGNHEDHQELGFRTTDELWPNVYYMPRGSVLELPDGRMVMFMGGAESIDRNSRVEGVDWFREEVISYADIKGLWYEGDVDIVISHTCPSEFEIDMDDKEDGYFNDCSRKALSYILHHYEPKRWYFGHWHNYMHGEVDGCRWTCLGHTLQANWWKWLD